MLLFKVCNSKRNFKLQTYYLLKHLFEIFEFLKYILVTSMAKTVSLKVFISDDLWPLPPTVRTTVILVSLEVTVTSVAPPVTDAPLPFSVTRLTIGLGYKLSIISPGNCKISWSRFYCNYEVITLLYVTFKLLGQNRTIQDIPQDFVLVLKNRPNFYLQ